MRDIRPAFQFGYINPVLVSDFIHYQFYQLFPPNSFLVTYHLALGSFSADGVQASMAPFWDAVDFLAARQVQRMSLGGVPLSAFLGRPKVLELTEQANARTPVPFSTDFEDSIDAIRALGLRRVAVAAKWDETLLRAVDAYLHHAGVDTAGTHGNAQTAQQVVALGPKDSIEVALSLGREAMARMPGADGLFLAGGAWLVQQAVVELEAELGVPVVTNPGATYWSALRSQGLRSPMDDAGLLIDSLR